MKKLMVFIISFLFLFPIVYSELDDSDLKKIEAVVRREVQSSNDKMRDDLKADIENVRTEVNAVLDDISGASSLTKIILVLTLAGAIIVAETCISFLKFIIWKAKRKLKPKQEQKKEQEPVKKLQFKKPEQKEQKPKKKLFERFRKPEPKIEIIPEDEPETEIDMSEPEYVEPNIQLESVPDFEPEPKPRPKPKPRKKAKSNSEQDKLKEIQQIEARLKKLKKRA